MDDDAPDRRAILSRRARLIALALTGAIGAAGCDSTPTACLRMAIDAGLDAGGEPEDASVDEDGG